MEIVHDTCRRPLETRRGSNAWTEILYLIVQPEQRISHVRSENPHLCPSDEQPLVLALTSSIGPRSLGMNCGAGICSL